MRFVPVPSSLASLGQGPFRVRGVVYGAVLRYVERRLPGGKVALREALRDDAIMRFFDQIFVASTDYDISPLVKVCVVSADLERIPPAIFTRDRARESAKMDVPGIYRVLLKLTSPEAMAERLPRAFNRYFEPCRADPTLVRRGGLESRLRDIPECMAGWYAAATDGFVSRALEMAGAKQPRFRWERAEAAGEVDGIATVTLPFGVHWG
jgi:hypothetical protein